MEAKLNTHIKLIGDNPLDAVLAERNTKAYLVASLAFIDGVEAAAEHYGLSFATVYAAMSFYEDNREMIEEELEKAHQRILEIGIDSKVAIAEFKRRMQDK